MPAARELTILTTLAQALSRPAELGDSLDAALSTVAEVLGLDTGWVWLLDNDTIEPHLAAARSLPASLRDHPDAMQGDCYCLKTFRAGDLHGAANVNVVRCSRLALLDDCSDATRCTFGLRSHASVPLAVGGRRLGMLNVATPDWRVLTDDELNLLTTLGALVSLVIERSRLETEGARAIAAEERNRIAREIHDTLAQALAALTLQLETVDALAAAQQDAALGDAVSRALALARSTLDEARCSVLDLRTSPLGGRALPQALEELAAETRDNADRHVEIRLHVHGFHRTTPDLPVAIEVGLYRITQQALANVLRHAGAARAAIRLDRAPGRVRLRVEDDGNGFEPDTVPPNRFGLVGMGERARLLGGRLTIETSPGVGTVVDVEIPLRLNSLRSLRSHA
ncbi:MAG: histidine kinase [Longimicrobiales bacterium]